MHDFARSAIWLQRLLAKFANWRGRSATKKTATVFDDLVKRDPTNSQHLEMQRNAREYIGRARGDDSIEQAVPQARSGTNYSPDTRWRGGAAVARATVN